MSCKANQSLFLDTFSYYIYSEFFFSYLVYIHSQSYIWSKHKLNSKVTHIFRHCLPSFLLSRSISVILFRGRHGKLPHKHSCKCQYYTSVPFIQKITFYLSFPYMKSLKVANQKLLCKINVFAVKNPNDSKTSLCFLSVVLVLLKDKENTKRQRKELHVQLNSVAIQVQCDLIWTTLWDEGWILSIACPCFDSELGDRDWITT